MLQISPGGGFTPAGFLVRRTAMIRAIVIVMIFTASAALGAPQTPSAPVLSTGPDERIIQTPKSAEWEGEWVSVSSQVDHLDRMGLFQKAAAAAKGPVAEDIKQAFLKRFRSDMGRVKISSGRFTFLSPDGSTVIGAAQYTYDGFVEQMSEGREIQWHRFIFAGGYNKYPVLVCSEPYGMLGQWMIVHGDSVVKMKTGRYDAMAEQAMMLPADLSAEAIGDALDTPEFTAFLLTLPISKKSEGGGAP